MLAVARALSVPALALRYVKCSSLLQVSVWPKGSDDDKIPFLTNSWVADGYGGRIFFSGAPKLPDQTPDGLKELRQQELDNLRVGAPNAFDSSYRYSIRCLQSALWRVHECRCMPPCMHHAIHA